MKVLIVVDMQEDFIRGALGTAEAEAIVDHVVARIKNSENELILFTQDTHQNDYLSTTEGKHLPVIHCVENTPGWAIDSRVFSAWEANKNTIRHPALVGNTFKKPVFGSVELVAFLSGLEEDFEQIEILGLCTDICVVSNAIMIKNILPDVPLVVNESCCAGVSPETHQQAMNVMQCCQIGVV